MGHWNWSRVRRTQYQPLGVGRWAVPGFQVIDMASARNVTQQRSGSGFAEHLFEKAGMFVLVLSVFAYGLAMVFLMGPT